MLRINAERFVFGAMIVNRGYFFGIIIHSFKIILPI